MVPQDPNLVFASTGATLAVGPVQGGRESSEWSGSKINGPDFRLALIEALRQAHLFTEVSSDGEADYALSAIILTQDQPGVGLGLKVTMAVKYLITDRRTGEEVFNDRVVSSYKAGMGEAFAASKRLRKANEGAVRENFKQLLEQIAALPLGTK